MKRLVATNIGVDAGMIIVADISYLEGIKHDKDGLGLGKTFKVPNGKYKVHYSIPETWNGPLEGNEELIVTGGEIFVVDPCYVIGKPEHEDWLDWLNKTDFGRNLNSNKAFILDEMGGDGCYEVRLELERL